MFYYSSRYYGSKSKKNEETEFAPRQQLYAEYVRDKAYLSLFFAGIWQALGEVIGDEELEKLIRILERQDEFYSSYATHYIDKCNIELITAPLEKRKDKLRNIAKRILKKPAAYYKLEESLRYWAKQYGTSIYELEDPRIQYPEDGHLRLLQRRLHDPVLRGALPGSVGGGHRRGRHDEPRHLP